MGQEGGNAKVSAHPVYGAPRQSEDGGDAAKTWICTSRTVKIERAGPLSTGESCYDRAGVMFDSMKGLIGHDRTHRCVRRPEKLAKHLISSINDARRYERALLIGNKRIRTTTAIFNDPAPLS